MLIEMFEKQLNKKCCICENDFKTLYLVTNEIDINFIICKECKSKLSLLLQQNKDKSILLSTGEMY